METKKNNLIVRLDPELHTKLKMQVVKEHTSLQAYVVGLILADQAKRESGDVKHEVADDKRR